MEPAYSDAQFWWWLVPLFVVLYFASVTWKRIRSRPHQVALASVVLGLGGLLFWPLGPVAIYCSRKAWHLGLQAGDPGVSVARAGAVFGYIASIFLGLALLMAAIYFCAWISGQYPFNESGPPQ